MENKKEDYLEFINSESYKHQIDIWLKAYNINQQKIELFYDFLFSLYNLIDETYLGEESIQSESDQRGHFDWCWKKTIDNFSKENIHFKDKGYHYDYLWTFFNEAFYYNHLAGKPIKIKNYLDTLFNFKQRKSRSELDVLSEIYKMLNLSLKK